MLSETQVAHTPVLESIQSISICNDTSRMQTSLWTDLLESFTRKTADFLFLSDIFHFLYWCLLSKSILLLAPVLKCCEIWMLGEIWIKSSDPEGGNMDSLDQD